MKRSGFKPKGWTPRPAKQIDYTPTPRKTVVAVRQPDAPLVAMPKREYVRDDRLLALLRNQFLACQHCGRRDGTICGAHSNWAVHGKGGAIKADDNRLAALCFACHSMLDQGSRLTELERQGLWWPAHVRTVSSVVGLGAWPPGMPIPDIERCPFELPLPV